MVALTNIGTAVTGTSSEEKEFSNDGFFHTTRARTHRQTWVEGQAGWELGRDCRELGVEEETRSKEQVAVGVCRELGAEEGQSSAASPARRSSLEAWEPG